MSLRAAMLRRPANLLHACCACNYIHLPLTRQHKTSVFVSRFTPSRLFLQYPTSSSLGIRRIYSLGWKKSSFTFAEQCKNKRRRQALALLCLFGYGTNPLCASERSESNFQFRTTVDSSDMFPPGACFCDYLTIFKTRHFTF